jgi:hypothetical protein
VPQIRDRVAINTSRVEESGGGDCAGSPIIDRTRLGASAMASAVASAMTSESRGHVGRRRRRRRRGNERPVASKARENKGPPVRGDKRSRPPESRGSRNPEIRLVVRGRNPRPRLSSWRSRRAPGGGRRGYF